MVIGDTVYFDLSLGSAVTAARCALLIGSRVQNETDCELPFRATTTVRRVTELLVATIKDISTL